MKLSNNRFSKSNVSLRDRFTGEIHVYEQYTYETHNALYDVVMANGQKLYRENRGPLSNRIDAITPFHVAIERHFDL